MLVAIETIKHRFQVLQKVKKWNMKIITTYQFLKKKNIYFIIAGTKRTYVLSDHRAEKYNFNLLIAQKSCKF